MKIIVTGANGYIGRHTVKYLLDAGHQVVAVDISVDKVDSRAILSQINIFNNQQGLFKLWGEPDALIHLAWQDGFIHNALSHINNLPCHFNFIRSLIDSGLKQVLVMGTMHELGYIEGQVGDETPTNPICLYGIAKNTLREFLECYVQGKDVVLQWCRGFYITGEDTENNSIFAKLMEKDRNGEAWFPFTDGINQYDFQDIHVLVRQIEAVISQCEITGTINCCSGMPVAIKDKVQSFLKEHQLKIQLDYGKFSSRPYDSPCIYGDASKIKYIIQQKYGE